MTATGDLLTDGDPLPESGQVESSPDEEAEAASDSTASTDEQPPDRTYLLRVSLAVLAVLLLSMVVDFTLFSRLEYKAAQHSEFNQFRDELASGTAPIGPTNRKGQLLNPGTPIALLTIPAIHLNAIVDEGTTSAVLMKGPGHRRDTPFPGQVGASYIFGRAAAYGGPFSRIHGLVPNDRITVNLGYGVATYKVIDVRRAGDPEPPALQSGQGRLTLETATGVGFMPSGVVYVDADMTSKPYASEAALASNILPADERAMAGDTSTVWALFLWSEVILALVAGLAWCWQRWGKPQAWIVFIPLLLVAGHFLFQQVALLLPNLT